MQKQVNIHLGIKFLRAIENLKTFGPTARLWIQYLTLVHIVKRFIEAERCGNWELHLRCVRDMIPYFHASGHYLYAKSSQLYLQEALKLKQKMTITEFDNFVNCGYFTIRRSNRYWSGIWRDR